MPFFNKRRREHNMTDTPADGHNAVGPRMQPPFRLFSWIRLHGVDLLTMAIMGALALGIYFAGPAPRRTFPIFNTDSSVIYPQFAYPLRRQIIPIWASALISFFVPFFFFLLFQIRRRSVDDLLTTTMGLLRSLITAALFQVIIKWLIGGLRPHFYAVCQPSVQAGQAGGSGFASLMYDRSVCTGNKRDVDDALESMPSGHATAAWAGLFFLALYFNAQLKVMSAHNPAYWKMILFFAPILGAFLISASLTIDRYHNWYDVLVGGLIGTAAAIVAFRQTFASVTDFRFNHILLPRATSLLHRQAFLPSGREPYYTYTPTPQFFSHDLPFTREGGWGHGQGEQFTGAPYDATVLTTGVGTVGNIANRNSTSTYGTYGGPGMGGGMANQKMDEAGLSGPGRITGTTAGNTTGNTLIGNHHTLGNNVAGNNLTGTGHHVGGTTGLGTADAGTRDPRNIV